MFTIHLKPVAPVVGWFLAVGALILIPAKSVAMDESTLRDLKSFFTHSRSDSVAMCKADVKAIMNEMRKYVNKGKSNPGEIEARKQKLDTIEDERMSLCEQNVISAMRLNHKNWELVDALKQHKTPSI